MLRLPTPEPGGVLAAVKATALRRACGPALTPAAGAAPAQRPEASPNDPKPQISGLYGFRGWPLGEAAHACGHPAKAIAHHTKALAVAADISDIDQQARAHTGLGHAHHALNQAALARRHYQHAMTLYTDLGTPDADRIRNHWQSPQTVETSVRRILLC